MPGWLTLAQQPQQHRQQLPLVCTNARLVDPCVQYTQLHDHTWDEVMSRMYEANMRNFVVYYHKELQLMFHHW
jgi:hypothetical protein